jgi:hypothetical protein
VIAVCITPFTAQPEFRISAPLRRSLLAFGDQQILIDADFSIESHERVCLIGRNALPAEIESREQRLAALRAIASEPGFYERPQFEV